MTKDLHLEIPNSTIIGAILTSIGAFGVFLGTRFLNSNDDIRKKVAKHDILLAEVIQNQERNIKAVAILQENHVMFKESLVSLNNSQESQAKDIEKLLYDITDTNGYVHTKMHDLVNILNEKMIKDKIVDNIDKKMDALLKKLNKTNKNKTK